MVAAYSRVWNENNVNDRLGVPRGTYLYQPHLRTFWLEQFKKNLTPQPSPSPSSVHPAEPQRVYPPVPTDVFPHRKRAAPKRAAELSRPPTGPLQREENPTVTTAPTFRITEQESNRRFLGHRYLGQSAGNPVPRQPIDVEMTDAYRGLAAHIPEHEIVLRRDVEMVPSSPVAVRPSEERLDVVMAQAPPLPLQHRRPDVDMRLRSSLGKHGQTTDVFSRRASKRHRQSVPNQNLTLVPQAPRPRTHRAPPRVAPRLAPQQNQRQRTPIQILNRARKLSALSKRPGTRGEGRHATARLRAYMARHHIAESEL